MSKEKFLKDSKIKDVMYHGTSHDFDDSGNGITKFKKSDRGMHFATPDKEFANQYAWSGNSQVVAPGAVYPVHVHAKHPWDYENPEHIKNLVNAMDYDGYAKDFPHRDKEHFAYRLSRGNWNDIERPEVQEAAKKLGHDAMYMEEGGAKNIGVFHPHQIKSAIGNNGNYDMSNPDITKAKGGKVSLDQMRSELLAKQPDMFAQDFSTKRTKGNTDSASHRVTGTKQGVDNFHKWFEGSHAVDEKGRPLRLYHSTNSDVSQFKPSQPSHNNYGILGDVPVTRAATFLTPNRKFSQEYLREKEGQNVMPVHAALKKPFDLRNGVTDKHWHELEKAGVDPRYVHNTQPWELFDNHEDGSNHFVDTLKKLGYDSAIFHENSPNDIDGRQTTYASFHPHQIKSAIGNRGTYDMNDSDITKAKGGIISTKNMKHSPVRKATGGDINEGAGHDTAQEGAFYRVRPRHIEKGAARPVGLLEEGGQNPDIIKGSSRDTLAEPHTDEQIQNLIKSGNTFAHQSAQDYNHKYLGYPHDPIPNLPSSFQKQNVIGKTFELAATGHPEYKKRIYDEYKRVLPEHVGEAKDYDELLHKAYGKLGEETHAQFNSLPVNMSFHRNGEGNYSSSKQMANDVHNNHHLYVFQGGDPHEHLHKVDPETGLSQNDMFRAVHDFYGHAMNGSQFGPHGEEKAWAEHSGMFSPLARAALSSETRGQNSMVNYTGLNAELKKAVAAQREAQAEAHRRGMHDQAEKHGKNIKDLMEHFKFAPQKSVLLPPEMLSGQYSGQVPRYLNDMVHPDEHMKKGGVVSHHTNSVHGMKASEALGNHEGKTLMATQADRTKVGNGLLGGPGFSSLQLDHPEYADKAWGVKNLSTARAILGANRRVPEGQAIWSTMIGTPQQHSSNQMVFDKLVNDFKRKAKMGQLDPELHAKINARLSAAVNKNGQPVFDPSADIMGRGFMNNADTFDKRRVIADLLGGNGIGGKKGQVADYDKIMHDTTEPILRDAPTGSIGNRLFSLNGETSLRPDLHPAFPKMLHGQDHGVSFEPVPNHVMLRDFHNRILKEKGRKAGVMDMTRGYAPSQQLTDEFLRHLQEHGYAKGGKVTDEDGEKEPQNITKAYKLFRVHKKHPGKLFPLFVDSDKPVEVGNWTAAKVGEMAGDKVKSKIGPLAYRPGWHAGDVPVATHIGEKNDLNAKAPTHRPDNHVWAEVHMPNDVDWQSEANRRGTNASGKVVPVKAHITDQIPVGGHYRYKTNPNMTGEWLIGGSMKVHKVLNDKEVASINKKAKLSDLPRLKPQNLADYGFHNEEK